MFIKGLSFTNIPETSTKIRPQSVKSNKKIMFDFQKHKLSKAAYEDMQLQ